MSIVFCHPWGWQYGVQLFLLDQGDYPEQDDGADDGGDNLANDGGTPVDAYPRQHVAADEAANDTDKEVDPEAETGPFHDSTCQEACQCSDEDSDNNTHSLCFLLVNNSFTCVLSVSGDHNAEAEGLAVDESTVQFKDNLVGIERGHRGAAGESRSVRNIFTIKEVP